MKSPVAEAAATLRVLNRLTGDFQDLSAGKDAGHQVVMGSTQNGSDETYQKMSGIRRCLGKRVISISCDCCAFRLGWSRVELRNQGRPDVEKLDQVF